MNLITISKKDFELFKKCVHKWVKRLALTGFEVNVCMRESQGDDDQAMAETAVSLEQCTAWIGLTDSFHTARAWDAAEIDATALHEVLEMKYARIRSFASQGISEKLVDEEIHRLIQLDTNVLMRRYGIGR